MKTEDLKEIIRGSMVDTRKVNKWTIGTVMNNISMESLFIAGFPTSKETNIWGKA